MVAPIVGLTGGIASGKSTVAVMFEDCGIPCLDADQVAREIVETGTEGFQAVVDAFGRAVVRADGALDRKALGALVFGDAALREQLNAILHPRIRRRSEERLTALASTDVPYVLYDAALMVENGLHRDLAALIVVRSSPERQRERLRDRDHLDNAAITARLNAQLNEDIKAAEADFVIDNGGSLDMTRRQVLAVDTALRDRFEGALE